MNKDLTTLFTGRSLTFAEEIDSTNSFLQRTLKVERLPEGAAIRVSRQIAGRGQADAKWESQDGKNLLCSFVFYPSFVAPKDVFILNKTFTLAVKDFASFWSQQNFRVKWPNDIYWNDKKVSGILIENSINSSSISQCILGIGFNVNQKSFSDSIPNATSLSLISNEEFQLDILFNSLCSFIEMRYLQLKNGLRSTIINDFNQSLYSINEWKNFQTIGDRFEGKIISVDENGRLVIESRQGAVRLFNAKEVRFEI